MEEESVSTDEEFHEEEAVGEEEEDLDPAELPDLNEYAEAADADEDEEDEDTGDTEVDEPAVEEEDEEDEEESEESLDVLLAREKVLDEDEVGRPADEPREPLSLSTGPIGDEEFTCRSCFLVKRRAQLANERKLICLDCA